MWAVRGGGHLAMLASIHSFIHPSILVLGHCQQVDRPASDPLLVPLSPGNKPDSSSILALLSAWLLVSVLVLLVPGLALHCGDVIPLNKNIWSVSYFLFTAGVSGVMLAVLYGVVDSPWRVGAVGMILQVQGRMTNANNNNALVNSAILVAALLLFFLPLLPQPFRWVGLNAILVYLGAATDLLDSALSCFFFDDPKNNMYNMMYSVVCSHAGESQPPLSNHCDAGIMIGVQAKVCGGDGVVNRSHGTILACELCDACFFPGGFAGDHALQNLVLDHRRWCLALEKVVLGSLRLAGGEKCVVNRVLYIIKVDSSSYCSQ